jgi:Zn-dependent membrane protease YugP
MILYILGFFMYAVPGLWVNYTLNKHDDVLPNMPFTAKEFGLNLLKEQNLDEVNIEDTKIGDHYDTSSKTVRVKPERLDKKSITSITVMCHEIGHAIQHKENYPPLIRRQKIISKTEWLNKLSSLLLYAGVPMILATGALPFIRICVIIIFASILINMISHLITLDVELDASFKRAMPILENKIPQEYHASCKSILRVCAFTYVIGSLTTILNVRNIWLLFRAVMFRR